MMFERFREHRYWVSVLSASLFLAACAPPRSEPDPQDSTAPLDREPIGTEAVEFARTPFDELAPAYAPEPGTTVYSVRPDKSLVQIRVFREGALARLGHNHLIAVRELRGWWRQRGDAEGRADLWFAVAGLTVDEPELRRAAGPEFVRQPDARAVAATRDNLLGERVLDAARFPWVRIAARYRPGAATAELRIRIRGEQRVYRVPVEFEKDGPRRTLRGVMRLRQSDFGMVPFSALRGALRVADELKMEFLVVAEPDSGER